MTSAYGTDDIWAVFDDSIITYTGPDGRTLTYGKDPTPYPEPLFGVTGWNPGEERPRPENDAANLRLAKRMATLGIQHVPSVGTAPDGSWSEPGFLLYGIDRSTALDIAREFGQLAIHELEDGKVRVEKTGIDHLRAV